MSTQALTTGIHSDSTCLQNVLRVERIVGDVERSVWGLVRFTTRLMRTVEMMSRNPLIM